jgi:hypothetical protein
MRLGARADFSGEADTKDGRQRSPFRRSPEQTRRRGYITGEI